MKIKYKIMYNYWHQCQLHYYGNTPDPPRHRNLPHLIDSLVILQGLCNQCVDCSILGDSRFFSTYRCLSCLRVFFPGSAAIFLLFAFVSCWHTRSLPPLPASRLIHFTTRFPPLFLITACTVPCLSRVITTASRARLD